jgi:sugar lactone lactonase YvrE
VRRLLPVAVALALLAGSAAGSAGGGSIWAFVSVSGGSRLAIVAVDGGGVVGRVALPPGSREVVATIDGRRVLAISAASGTVNQLDGVTRTVTRTFRGFVRPIAAALAPRPTFGLVGSRYAYVTDEARGRLVVLDLARGQTVLRLPVGPRPARLALVGNELWISHDGSGELTVVDVADARRPRVVGRARAGGEVLGLAGDETRLSLFVTYRGSRLLGRLDTMSRRLVYRRAVPAGARYVTVDVLHRVWTTGSRGGRATVLAERTGLPLFAVRVPAKPTALVPIGSWTAVAAGSKLTLLAPHGTRRTVRVGSGTAGVAFAVR